METTVAAFRPSFALSCTMETTVSKREIDDVSAANSTSRKNAVPNSPPIFMEPNTFGSTPNISPGPACPRIKDASPPLNATTAGTIIRPARNAIPVSKISICATDFSRLSSFFI